MQQNRRINSFYCKFASVKWAQFLQPQGFYYIMKTCEKICNKTKEISAIIFVR